MRILIEFAASFIRVILVLIEPKPKVPNDFKARFGEPRKYFRRRKGGFVISGNLELGTKTSFQNLLIVGTTGSGKTSCTLIPSILKANGSMVIHDPSGELFEKTTAILKEKGYTVSIFNPGKPDISESFNVFSYKSNSSDLHKLSRTLVMTARRGESKEAIWDELATSLISLLVRTLSYKPKIYQNLPNVLHLLHAFGEEGIRIKGVVYATGDLELRAELDSFLSYEAKMQSSVLATAKGALHYLADPCISKVTSNDSISLDSLRKERRAIFIQNITGEGNYYRPLLSLFFEVLFSELFRKLPDDEDQNVLLILDEASSLVCPTLPLAIANLRKYRVGVALALQEFSQLIDLYGKEQAETIRSNCNGKLYFGGGSLISCQEISESLGVYSFIDTDGIKKSRRLLMPDEIRMLDKRSALFFSGNSLPMTITLKPYYTDKRYKGIGAEKSVPKKVFHSDSVDYYPLAIDLHHVPKNSVPKEHI